MVEMVSSCSRASESTSLPSVASMVSISSMFMSMAPIRILRAKIVSLGAGRSCGADCTCADAGAAGTAMVIAATVTAHAASNRRAKRIGPSLLARTLFQSGPFLVADIGGEHFAGRKHGKLSHEAALLVGVTQRMEHDLDLIARLHHVAAPAANPHQISWAGRLHQPLGGGLARVERTVEGQGDVRVDPAQFHHGSPDRHGLGEIEHGR